LRALAPSRDGATLWLASVERIHRFPPMHPTSSLCLAVTLAVALGAAVAPSQELAWRRSPFGGAFTATWDPNEGRVFLFAQRPFVWNDARWLPRGEGPTPSWYQAVRSATDFARGRVYLLGAYFEPPLQVQLWRDDGDGWTSLPLAVSGAPLLAYDSARCELVVVGATDRRSMPLPYTYLFGDRGWRTVASIPGSGGAWIDALAYDERRQRAVAVTASILPNQPNESWEWDGTAWTLRAASGFGVERRRVALGYDPMRGSVQAYGGIDANVNRALRDHYEWDGTAWRARSPVAGPNVGLASLVHDPARHRMVLVGVGELGYET
jgi:hypothetical protein